VGNAIDRDRRVAQVREEILEPALPICDPHHHLWDHPGRRYLLDELLADTGSGHNVTATVFVECLSMYRADGPEAMRPVGETEFVNGVAEMLKRPLWRHARRRRHREFRGPDAGESVGEVPTPTWG
jgi:hypothetical protein